MNTSRLVSDGVYIEHGEGLDEDTANEFASFIDDMNATENADAWITVMRIPTDSRGAPMPNSKHLGQLFNEPLGASSVNDVIERIRREYIRPGENSITVRIIGKQQGQKGLKFNRIYTIEKANAGKPESGGNSFTELGNMLLQMQRASDERAERLERLLAAPQVRPAGESVVDSLVKLAPILTPFITGLLGRPAPAATDPAASMLATLRAFKEARGMFDGGGSDDGESTMKTIRAVAEVVGPGLKFLAAREERTSVAERMARAALPAPEPQKAAPPPVRPKPVPRPTPKTPNPKNEAEEMELKELREKVDTLAALCDDGQKPEDVAQLVIDNIEDDQLEELYNQVSPENFVARIKVLNSKAVTGRELWFEKLRVAIMAEYETDPDAGASGTFTEDDAEESAATPAQVNGAAPVDANNLGASPVDLDSIPDAGGNA